MQDWEQRLDYLEHANDTLHMQNRVLAVALQALLHALPEHIAQDAAESVQAAFEEELDELNYTDSIRADLFQDAAEAFFRSKR